MTLEEIRSTSKDMLTPTDVAPVLRCSPYTVTIAARKSPERLGFPVNVMGSRVRIPRLPFLAFVTGEGRTESSSKLLGGEEK